MSLYPLADFSPHLTWGPLSIYPLAEKVCDRPLSLYPLADFSPRLTWGPLSPYLFPISMLSSAPFRTNRANSSPFWPLAMYPLHPKLPAADTGGPTLRPTPLSSYPSSVFAELPTFRLKNLYVSTLHRFPARILEGGRHTFSSKNVSIQKVFPWGLWKDLGILKVPWGSSLGGCS